MFMKMLVRHHAEAIQMIAECLFKSYHSALDQFCSKVIEDQNTEVKSLKNWLCSWYQICEGQNREDEMNMPARITSAALSEGRLALSFFAEPDKQYTIESKENLASGAWDTLQQVTGNSGVQTLSRDAQGPGSRRFFRIRENQL